MKNIAIKKQTYCFFSDIAIINNFDSNKIKIDEKSYKNIFIYYIGYVTIKDLKYVKVNSVNFLYLTFSKVNVYFEEINGNKYIKRQFLPMKAKIKLKSMKIVEQNQEFNQVTNN